MPDFDLNEVLKGDPKAVHAFVLEYSPLFCQVVRSILVGQNWGNRQEDLVQDIFLALIEDKEEPYKALRAWRPDGGSPLKVYLWRFARYRVLDRLRTRGFGGKGTTLLPAEELGRLAECDPNALFIDALREECTAVIQLAKQVLSESDQRFFVEAFMEDRETAELARTWQKSEGAIHQQRTRVRQAVTDAFHRSLLDSKSKSKNKKP